MDKEKITKRLCDGFKVIPVKYSKDSTVLRCLFVKPHHVRDTIPEKPAGRTLFVLNVPPFCNEQSLKNTFSCFGEVENVFCHLKPTIDLPPTNSGFFSGPSCLSSYKVAYIVFELGASIHKVKTFSDEEPLLLTSEENPIVAGYSKWCNEYNSNIITTGKLLNHVNSFMMKFDEEEEKKELEIEKLGKEDEDGWITVTSKNKKKRITRTESTRNKILQKENEKQSKKQLKNFYTFQIRESKMKHLESMRRKFEEDKKKVNALKQSRKFKPF